MGSTIFFTRFTSINGRSGPPVLCSVTFRDYVSDESAGDLVQQEMRLLSPGTWPTELSILTEASFLYASGPASVTLSLAFDASTGTGGLDTVVAMGGETECGLAVHYTRDEAPGLGSALRDVVTLPGLTCRATTDGAPVRCHSVAGGRHTWAYAVTDARFTQYAPLTGGFDLPASVWLLDAVVARDAVRALVGAETGPAVALTGDTLWAVEGLPDATCAAGRRLFLLRRALPDLSELGREPLSCEWRQQVVTPAVLPATRWLGPWADDFALLIPLSVENRTYYAMGAEETAYEGDRSREHTAVGPGLRVVQQLRAGAPVSCPWLQSPCSAPRPLDVAAGAVDAGRVDCLRPLLEGGLVGPDECYDGRPLTTLARSVAPVLLLLDAGADPEAKAPNGATALTNLVAHGVYVAPLLKRGVAVCTWPVNPATARPADPRRRQRFVDAAGAAIKVQMSHPCEPGFSLREGANCAGLTPCTPGFYCPGYLGATNKRTPCPAGTYLPDVMARSAAQCRPCPADAPYSGAGSSDISECVNDPALVVDKFRGTPVLRIAECITT